MTYITQLIWKQSRFGSRIMVTALVVLGIIAMQSRPVHAQQWTTPDAQGNINNTNTGNVGIGTTSPTSKLTIYDAGNTAAGQQIGIGYNPSYNYTIGRSPTSGFLNFTGTNVTSQSYIGYTFNGNVGIGTTTPGTFFGGVAGSGRFLHVGNTSDHAQLLLSASGAGRLATINMEVGDATAAKRVFQTRYDGANNIVKSFFFNEANGAVTQDNVLVLKNNGNVGIGTAAPNYPFEVQANTQWVARFKKTDATNGGILIDSATGYNPNVGLSVNGVIKWYMNSTVSSGDSLQFWESSGSNPRFTLTQAGSVGIGTSGPGYRLDVQGGQINSSGGLCIAGICKSAWSEVVGSQWTPSGSNIYYGTGNVGVGTISGPAGRLDVRQISNSAALATLLTSYGATEDTYLRGGSSSAVVHIGDVTSTTSKLLLMENGGNVGIGTSSPTSPLFIAGNEPSTDYATLRIKPTVTHGGIVIDSANNTSQAHLRFFKTGVPKWQIRVPFQDGVEDFRLFSFTTATDVLNITPAGNVGIGTGTTTPSTKLHVAGDITVTGTGNISATGTINAKYQDVAEWVESSQALAAGTVVVLDHTRSNQVIASSQAYDTRVAGVISLQPGIALGESGAGKVLVATTGRVKIKVDASAGAILIGDLLVTSDREGIAKKSEPLSLGGVAIHRPGTLIGKALEPLAKGTGEILVLLSLQ